MVLSSLLVLAWLHGSCARDLAQASSSNDCTTVNSASALNSALPASGGGARRLCLDPTDERCGGLLCRAVSVLPQAHGPLESERCVLTVAIGEY